MSHTPHKRIEERKQKSKLMSRSDRIALWIVTIVGTMTCAGIFAAITFTSLPSAWKGGAYTLVQWFSTTFLQLTLLPIIMVGQNIMSRESEKRAMETYRDCEALLEIANDTLKEVREISTSLQGK